MTFTTNLRHDGLLFYIIILNSKLFTQNVTTWRRLDAYPATTAQHQIQFSNKNINYSCLPHKFQIIYRNSVLIFCSIIMPLFKYMNFRYRCTIIGPTTIFRRRPNVAFSWLRLPHYLGAGPTKFCRRWANASCYWGLLSDIARHCQTLTYYRNSRWRHPIPEREITIERTEHAARF